MKKYMEPEMEIILLQVEDIITTSSDSGLDEDELPPIPVASNFNNLK